ncbi:MAG: choice-of-anchor tandem repeat GloVer-containing protein [Candidatus Cybelea sp.]
MIDRRLFSALFLAVLLSDCATHSSPAVPPEIEPSPPGIPVPGPDISEGPIWPSPGYSSLYSFHGSPDGANPYASLLDVKGTLFGTTFAGGRAYQAGTVFSITTSGTEHVLHSFGNGSDGYNPLASLIEVNGTLYGTTIAGGTFRYEYGTVFRISTTGTEHVLHSFGQRHDGQQPYASLIDVNGTLYGTTYEGGSYNAGTFFSISTNGTEHVLHNFSNLDAVSPTASLIDVKGVLYGTSTEGGRYTYGTVFSIGTTGTVYVLHSFGHGHDGDFPAASLINVNGTLYGTTPAGGMHQHGTVFRISTTGAEHVLYSFKGGSDGADPYASLLNVNGTLYGTTLDGGRYNYGTLFSVSTAGTEHVLHSFGNGSDGSNPSASLVDVRGVLFGTTRGGGEYGYGTVFALIP